MSLTNSYLELFMKVAHDIPLGALDTSTISDAIIILDIDGTITSTRLSYISPEIRATIDALKKTNDVFVFSNNVDNERNLTVADDLDLPYLNSSASKPFPKVIEALSNPHHKPIIVIGDRWLTDGWFAHNIGARFIKVCRVTDPEDGLIFKIVYFIDDALDFFIKRIKRRA